MNKNILFFTFKVAEVSNLIFKDLSPTVNFLSIIASNE